MENNYPKLKIGTVLIAKHNCKMKDGSGSALIVGKEYQITFIYERTQEIVIKSELFDDHFFDITELEKYFAY